MTEFDNGRNFHYIVNGSERADGCQKMKNVIYANSNITIKIYD